MTPAASTALRISGPEPETSPQREIIRLESITKIYHLGDTEVRALDGVSMSVARGEFVSLMGPSGSGKSTLLQMIGCLDSPTEGRYFLDDQAVESLSQDELARIRQRQMGFVFQSYHLVSRMTAARNVELPLILAGIAPAERRARVAAALAAMGLEARANHRPDQLSGGERQRVAIARATVMEPRILLADEPTGNLDTKTGEEIIGWLEKLHRAGLTLLMVTHDPRMGARAQRVITMRDGRLIEEVRGRESAP